MTIRLQHIIGRLIVLVCDVLLAILTRRLTAEELN